MKDWKDRRIKEIEERERAATPGPWKRSYYVRHRRYDNYPPEWHKAAKEGEARIIRGSGQVGSPECNPVLIVDGREEDKDFISHARNDIPFLLNEIKTLRKALAAEGKE